MFDVLVDYVTFSDSVNNIFDIMASLGLDDGISWVQIGGRYGWQRARFYRGITIYSGGREDIGVNISGKGCRTIESLRPSFDWTGFLLYRLGAERRGEGHISRLDIAADDHDGILRMDKLFHYTASDRYICKAKFHTWTQGSEEHLYFGSPSSDRRVRIYNKALEQGLEDVHWIRAEMQMRDDAAVSFLLNLEQEKGDVGEVYAGVLNGFLRYISEPVQGTHYDRAKVVRWWSQFVGTVRKCPTLRLLGDDYTMVSVYGFLERQAASSLRLWLEAHHGDITDVLAMVEGARLNKRQSELLSKIKEEFR